MDRIFSESEMVYVRNTEKEKLVTMGWTHAICSDCWTKDNPGKEAVRVKAEFCDIENCCICGERTASGIFIRMDPKKVKK